MDGGREGGMDGGRKGEREGGRKTPVLHYSQKVSQKVSHDIT